MTNIVRSTNSTLYAANNSNILISKDRFRAPKVTFFIDAEATCILTNRKEAAYALRKFRKIHAKKTVKA